MFPSTISTQAEIRSIEFKISHGFYSFVLGYRGEICTHLTNSDKCTGNSMISLLYDEKKLEIVHNTFSRKIFLEICVKNM